MMPDLEVTMSVAVLLLSLLMAMKKAPSSRKKIPPKVVTLNGVEDTNMLSEAFPLATDTPHPAVKPLLVDPMWVPPPGMSGWGKEPRRRVARVGNAENYGQNNVN